MTLFEFVTPATRCDAPRAPRAPTALSPARRAHFQRFQNDASLNRHACRAPRCAAHHRSHLGRAPPTTNRAPACAGCSFSTIPKLCFFEIATPAVRRPPFTLSWLAKMMLSPARGALGPYQRLPKQCSRLRGVLIFKNELPPARGEHCHESSCRRCVAHHRPHPGSPKRCSRASSRHGPPGRPRLNLFSGFSSQIFLFCGVSVR